MEYIYNFICEQIEYIQETFGPKYKNPILINFKDDYYCDEVNDLIESVEKEIKKEKEIKTEKELELLEIRYNNLVKDVDELFKQLDEDDEESDDRNNDNNNNNGKVGILLI
jgi:hypothetical protein